MLTPPLGSIWDIFEFENILMAEEPPRINILKGLFRHIYIEKGQIKCCFFSFLGWGLKVTYNLDIFEKLRPPPHGVSNVRIWISDIFVCFFNTPTLSSTY